jgi:Protein of unknown function (DUF3455)
MGRKRTPLEHLISKGNNAMWSTLLIHTSVAVCSAFFACSLSSAQVPEAIAAPNENVVMTVHAEGAQIYECKSDASGKLLWQFREPIATLLLDGKTVGRHYAGPNWELADGSAVTGKLAGRAAGATAKDIPLLKLEATAQRGAGQLTAVATIQRLNTKGGVAEGPCAPAGTFQSVPYSADYTFLKKGG